MFKTSICRLMMCSLPLAGSAFTSLEITNPKKVTGQRKLTANCKMRFPWRWM